MEPVSKNILFGLKMMVKSGLETIFPYFIKREYLCPKSQIQIQ